MRVLENSAAAALETEATEFERQEAQRRQQRQHRYEAAGELRARASEIDRYYQKQVQALIRTLVLPGSRVLDVGCGFGDLLASMPVTDSVGLESSARMVEIGRERHPELDLRTVDVERDPLPSGPFDTVILSGSIGRLEDIQTALERVRPLLAPRGRLVVTYYNFIWEPLIKLAETLRLKPSWPDQNWLSMSDIENVLYLAGFEVFRRGTDVLMPVPIPGVAGLANRVLAKLPAAREFALVDYFVARPAGSQTIDPAPSVSVICPCRNERGNIKQAILRTPVMGSKTELIFVDGNSTDGTVEEIESLIREYRGPLNLRLIRQGDGKGKGDAVRKGFAVASCDVLMILDSDLTVPPEDLPKFYRALVEGRGEFINGVRLVYPMDGEAMRFLNLLGNKFFSLALSWLLEQPVKDSLCGTKVLYRRDYETIAANRGFFGDFDPFGDFDLLFGAARLNLRIVDLPVRYRARTYGETKISRFSHGWLLLKMTAFGFKKLRLGA